MPAPLRRSASPLRRAVALALAALVLSSMGGALPAQDTRGARTDPTRSGALYDELARMDSLVFDAAFVACDTTRSNALFTDDVEFYHDRGGLSVGPAVRANTARMASSCPGKRGLRRVLVPGSLRVYPIHEYGAAQMGEHRFVEQGAATATTAQFVHVWQKKEGVWRISRVLSLDHRPVAVAR